MNHQGKLIVIEGIDQAGKATQTAKLSHALRQKGYHTVQLGFPAYETQIGQQIKAFLQGNIEIPLHVRYMLYAANRYEFKAEIETHLASGRIVLMDRYSPSGIVYGMVHGLSKAWLEGLEQELPKADLVIFLDLSPEIAVQRKQKDRDRYEQNLSLLNACQKIYQNFSTQNPTWHRISAEQPPDIIAQEIETIVFQKTFSASS